MHLLIPPIRKEIVSGILWWKKRQIEFVAKIAREEQAMECGIAMFRALESEYKSRRKIVSITVLIIGEVKPTFHCYEAFVQEAESNKRVNAWLLETVPVFSLNFETPSGDMIRCYEYLFDGVERVMMTMQPQSLE